MKSITLKCGTPVVLGIALLLAGCRDQPDQSGQQAREIQKQQQAAQQAAQHAERELRTSADNRAEAKSQEAGRWRSLAAFAVSGAAILFIFGTALGSSARRRSDAPRR